MALLTVALSVSFTACSDDDENAGNDLVSIIASGAWENDGDDDIFVLSKDGVGFEYTNPAYYKLKRETGCLFTWEYENNIVSIEFAAKYDDGEKTNDRYDYVELRVISYDRNKIVFKIENSDDNFDNSPCEFENGTWTWTRYR